MAKIKRFYLFIAALIWSKSYGVNAAEIDCSTISGLQEAQSCYDYWSYESGYRYINMTYSAYINSGLFDGDWHTCYQWSDNAEDGNDHDPDAYCTEIYFDELAGACCSNANASNEADCSYVLQDFYTCKDNSGSEAPPSGCVAKACNDGYGLDPIEGCMRCENGQYVKNNQTVQSETDECWHGPVCADCPGYWTSAGTHLDAYTSDDDEPGSTINSCFISGLDDWTFSDNTGNGKESFLYDCLYEGGS